MQQANRHPRVKSHRDGGKGCVCGRTTCGAFTRSDLGFLKFPSTERLLDRIKWHGWHEGSPSWLRQNSPRRRCAQRLLYEAVLSATPLCFSANGKRDESRAKTRLRVNVNMVKPSTSLFQLSSSLTPRPCLPRKP